MILQEVESIEPFDALESQQKSETLAWILSGAQLCRTEKPSTPPCHLVSYFVVVDGDYILLVDHKNAGLWLPTGGHVEPDEHPRETVLREAKEELSIEAKFLFLQKPLFITSTTTVGQTADIQMSLSGTYSRVIEQRAWLSIERSFTMFAGSCLRRCPLKKAIRICGDFCEKCRLA